jgi:hypothetical protein
MIFGQGDVRDMVHVVARKDPGNGEVKKGRRQGTTTQQTNCPTVFISYCMHTRSLLAISLLHSATHFYSTPYQPDEVLFETQFEL